jgi:uncharacterized membrane protein YedE/YeeE
VFFLKKKRWWPVAAGIAFAFVELFSFWFSERPLGATRGYTITGSIIEYLISPEHSENVSYWEVYWPVIDWAMAVLVGLVLGGFISTISSKEFRVTKVPELWKTTHGASTSRRWFWAFVGGFMMGFAARLTGGCVSGLLISAAIQLSPGGYIFMFSLWIGGLITTMFFYRTRSLH